MNWLAPKTVRQRFFVALGHAKRLDTGDVLIVTRLDRLAGSTRDLLNTGRKA